MVCFKYLIFACLVHASVLAEVQSLDGAWEIIFDHQSQGQAAGWHESTHFWAEPSRRTISVPSCWETIEQDYEGVAYYGRRFVLPESWVGKVVRLQFDAVNYRSELWVNDAFVGKHQGGYGPFEFRVDPFLKAAENTIILRVLGPIVVSDRVIDGLAKNDMPHWRGALTGGIWQSTRLVAAGSTFVDSCFVQPRLADDTIAVELTLQSVKERPVHLEFALRAVGESEVVAQRQLGSSSSGQHHLRVMVPHARYWSPESPQLYVLSVQVRAGEVVLDSQEYRFGMREFSASKGRFQLNGKPIYVKAAFFEGLYPHTLALPESAAIAQREIQLAKEAGFNMIRPWRKPPPRAWLDLCDEMGMMVVGGLPIECMNHWPSITPELPRRIEHEVRSAILRDRNRACVVLWEIFNEIHRPELKRLKQPMAQLARELDPTRLIIDESGGFAGGAHLYLPGSMEPEPFHDIHAYPGAPLNGRDYHGLLTRAQGTKQLAFVSEIGYGSLPDLVANNARFAAEGNPLTPPYRYHRELAESLRSTLAASGLDAVYPSLQRFCQDQQTIHAVANKRMIEAIRANPNMAGFAIHALTDGDWVLGAGLLDLFREPKPAYEAVREVNQARYLALLATPRNVYAKEGATLKVTGINEQPAAVGKLTTVIRSSAGDIVFQNSRRLTLAAGISPVFEQALDTSAWAGPCSIQVDFRADDGPVLASNSLAIEVFPAVAPRHEPIATLDPDGNLRAFLRQSGRPFRAFDAQTPLSQPVFVGELADSADDRRFSVLADFVQRGGTAVYLETIQRKGRWQSWLPGKPQLPLRARSKNAFGLWVAVSHVVRPHPVFAGLPSGGMMDQTYENIYAPHTLMGLEGELIVGSVSHSFHEDKADNQNYLGPGPAWCGMDLGVIRHGEGRYVLSALRLLENLGQDPVADRILHNLIVWTVSGGS
jgi:beta-galactosidase